MWVDSPVITSVFKVITAVCRVTERRYDDARTLPLAVWNEGKRNRNGYWRLFYLRVKHLSHNLVVRDDDSLVEMELVMRMLSVAARGERARPDVDLPVVHLLDPVAVKIVLVVFGEHLSDDTFLRVEIKLHLVGIVFLTGLREDRLANDSSCGIRHSLRINGVLLEVKLDIVGLNLDVVVFDYRTAIIVNLVVLEILDGGVVTAAFDLGVNLALTPADKRKNHHAEEKNNKKTICWPCVQDFYLIL